MKIVLFIKKILKQIHIFSNHFHELWIHIFQEDIGIQRFQEVFELEREWGKK